VDFLKNIAAAVNSGLVEGPVDLEVELIEIEPLHTTINGNSIIIQIEPANLSIQQSINITMGEQGAFYGRAEGMPIYQQTRRSFSLSFDMIKSQVLNGSDAVSNNAIVVNLLQQLQYPAYTPVGNQNTSVLKTPPFFRIQYGDIIGDFFKGQKRGVPGYMTGLDVSLGGGGWGGGSIGDNLTLGIGDVKIPIQYGIRIGFNVVHDHVVGWYDGKFAGDGRNNWPLNTGVVIDSSQNGPGNAGIPASGETIAVPGAPATVCSQKTQNELMEK